MTETLERTDNVHCFEKPERAYWLAIAQGFRPLGEPSAGGKLEFAHDDPEYDDGCVAQNGGIFSPQETRMRAGVYIRFFDTTTMVKFGPAGGMSGGWWVNYETYQMIIDWAEDHDLSIAQAAQRLIVLPRAWSDAAYMGAAFLSGRMKAWVGKGKPATGKMSPHNLARMAGPGREKTPMIASPPHLEIKQFYVPGGREIISKMFEIRTTAPSANGPLKIWG